MRAREAIGATIVRPVRYSKKYACTCHNLDLSSLDMVVGRKYRLVTFNIKNSYKRGETIIRVMTLTAINKTYQGRAMYIFRHDETGLIETFTEYQLSQVDSISALENDQ